MITGKARVSAKGWVVIPKAIRDEMRIKPGDEVEVQIDEDGNLRVYRVPSRSEAVRALRGKYKMPGERSMTDDLLDEKRKERERDVRLMGPPLRAAKRRKVS